MKYPFAQAAAHGHGTVLRHHLEVPTYDCEDHTRVNYIETVCLYNEEKAEIIVFAVNRHPTEAVELDTVLEGFNPTDIREFSHIHGHEVKQTNTAQAQPISPTPSDKGRIENGRVSAVLAPLSWNMVRVGVAS